MATMSFAWTLLGAGWAECRVEDSHGHAEACFSYISPAPEDFLSAVARLVLGTSEQRVQFRGEPDVFRWIFHQDRGQVTIRLLWAREETRPDETSTLIWISQQPVDTLARATIRAFDQLKTEHGDHDYLQQWRSPFPHQELEALRAARRTTLHKTTNTTDK